MNIDFCPNCFEKKDGAGVICPHCGYDASSDERQYPMALRAGAVLGGKYIIGRVLGEGGFGVTYLAQDYKEKMPVALKEYFPDSLAARPNARLLGSAGGLGYYVQFPMGIGVIEDETAKEKMKTAYDQVETFVQSVKMK